jgi:hypothetical protein
VFCGGALWDVCVCRGDIRIRSGQTPSPAFQLTSFYDPLQSGVVRPEVGSNVDEIIVRFNNSTFQYYDRTKAYHGTTLTLQLCVFH